MPELSADYPKVSVIVPVFNDAVGLRRCLEALDDQSLPKDRYEVIVVDNGSQPPLASVVAPFQFARCVVEAKQGSYAARNTGVRNAVGELLAFTDADCEPSPDWLEQFVRTFECDDSVSALGGRVGISVSLKRKIAELYELVLTPFPQQKFIEREGFSVTANLAIRSSVFRSVGPFNERLFSSGDREWGNRMVAAGYQLRYAPQCTVIHPARRTIRSLIQKRRRIEGGTLGLSITRTAGQRPVTFARLHPPRSMLAATLLLSPGQFGLGRIEGLQVLMLAGFLVAVRIGEALRLRCGGVPVR
jgi:glycosyltransferase involved in cell wall biosynthesis